jgi:hypothetical protein
MTAYINHNNRENDMKNTIRTINAIILTPVMKLTGFRFSKSYRHEDTKLHSLAYALIDTVGANTYANKSMQVLALSLIASCAIAAFIVVVLINAPQYRVNVIDGHITLTK